MAICCSSYHLFGHFMPQMRQVSCWSRYKLISGCSAWAWSRNNSPFPSGSQYLPHQGHEVLPSASALCIQATSLVFLYVDLASIWVWVDNLVTTFAFFLLVQIRHGVSCFGRHDLANGPVWVVVYFFLVLDRCAILLVEVVLCRKQ
jgi:hypothetical protein